MNLPRLSSSSENLVAAAVETSSQLGHHFLGVEHIFLSLAGEPEIGLDEAFQAQGLDLADALKAFRQKVEAAEHPSAADPSGLTPRCHSVLQMAGKIATRLGGSQIEPAHILEAVLREGRSMPVRFLLGFGVDVAELQATAAAEPRRSGSTDQGLPLLGRFGRDLTGLALAGRLSPLVGRERELDLLAQVLLRKNKNNPVLVGEAGVGKTAVVEGFAQRLLSPDCPLPLRGRRIVELSIAALVAGTKYRGDFEERLVGIIGELAGHPEIVLFVDEIHTLVGAGAASGDAVDAANILKPALARGELRCIGATTIAEYRRYIERDQALERRFDKLQLEEPSPEETVRILSGLSPSFEAHHVVTIPAETLLAAVELTVRCVPDRSLPDKALDALDQACARKRLSFYARRARGEVRADTRPAILPEDIAATVAQWTGLPVERISGAEGAPWLDLERQLSSRVIGQDHAVRAVTRAIITAKAGLAPASRPLGVFLFLGPTGVGKTELAKSLAAALFGHERRLIRFDMSEYAEPHSAAKLIGSPPGYVGHEREGLLIAAVRSHPHSVVLFDEVEKAHPDIFDLFLQIFEDGRLSGAHGKAADFTHALIILTSNLVPVPAAPVRPVGFLADREAPPTRGPMDPRLALLGWFRAELVNRIDEVIVFNPLGQEHLRQILEHYINELEQLLASRKLKLELDARVYEHLIALGASQRFGARELRRVVDGSLRQPLAREILKRPDHRGTIRVVMGENGLELIPLPQP